MTPVEPEIDLDDVQGNIFPGFNKDHQTLRFLGIADVAPARAALAELIADMSTSTVVRLFAQTRALVKAHKGGGPSGLTATWANIAFSYAGLQKLAPPNSLGGFGAGAFRVGLASRSALLGDPSAPAVTCTAPTGRTHGRTDQREVKVRSSLPRRRRPHMAHQRRQRFDRS